MTARPYIASIRVASGPLETEPASFKRTPPCWRHSIATWDIPTTISSALTSRGPTSISPRQHGRTASAWKPASMSSPASATAGGDCKAVGGSSLGSSPTLSSALGIRYSPRPSQQNEDKLGRHVQRMLVLKKVIQSTFKKFGYRIVRDGSLPDASVPPACTLEPFFSLLKRNGFNPKHIIDVGANKGTWTRRALSFFPDANYTLVEPQDHLRGHIQDMLDRGSKITWINAGVADQSGALPFTISSRDDSSTFAPTLVDAAA